MFKKSALTVGLLLLVSVPCRAQELDSDLNAESVGPRFWTRLEYLLWHVQAAPLPQSLVTTGGTTNLGALGASDTSTVYGGAQDYGWMSGARLSTGIWYDFNNRIGMEGAFFMFGSRSQYFNTSAPVGSVLTVPYSSGSTPAFQSLASPTQSGSINIENDIRFLGGYLDFVIVPYRGSLFELNVLVGFGSVYLKEDYTQNASTTTVSGAGGTTTSNFQDAFGTQNTFYGADLGLRGIFSLNPFFLSATGRVAFGTNQQIVDIAGQTNTTTTVAGGGTSTTTANSGLLAQQSNMGNYSQNTLCILPQLEIRLGVDLSENIRFSIGYDLLYMTNVVRPGNQIDQSSGVVNGTTHPVFSFSSSGFMAQGMNVGLEFRF